LLLWLILGCLTAIVLFFLLGPLYHARVAERERAAFDAEVYRDQLGEVESDRERGLKHGVMLQLGGGREVVTELLRRAELIMATRT